MGQTMTEVELAYIAGFVDGEGSISIYRRAKDTYTPYLSVSNTNLEVLEYINHVLGDTGYLIKMKMPNPKHKTAWKLRFDSVKCNAILKLLLPYLRLKHRQAEMAIIVADFQSANTRGQQVPDYIASVKLMMYEGIKKLNTKGSLV